MRLWWRRTPRTETAIETPAQALEPRPAQPRVAAPRDWPALEHWQGTAARRAIVRHPHLPLVPANASAAAFVRWMQDLKLHGKHVQADLYDLYVTVCDLAGYSKPMSLLSFGEELVAAGCRRWRANHQGKSRHRPLMVEISCREDDAVAVAAISTPAAASAKASAVRAVPAKMKIAA